MGEITHYKSSDGKEQLITEMNPFHLVNALLKVAAKAATDVSLVPTLEALKSEVLNRLAPPQQ